MLERNIFQPSLAVHPVNFTIKNVVEILQRQAELQKISIIFVPLQEEHMLMIDMMRTQ
jgi:hypothetical protein